MATSMSIFVIMLAITSVLGAPGWHYRKPTYKKKPAAARQQLPTIVGAAVATDSLSTLVAAVKAAGLVDTLNSKGPFTVFAPNNAAFAKIPADALANLLKPENVDQLKAILLRHVVPGTIKAADIPAGSTTLTTADPKQSITVINSGGVFVQGEAKAKVIATDVVTSNGVVHIVDTVF